MNATVKAILRNEAGTRPPRGKALKALQADLVSALVGMGKAERIGATKALAAHLAKHWAGKGDREAALKVIRAYGQTEAYREVYRLVLTCDAWMGFAREFSEDLASAL